MPSSPQTAAPVIVIGGGLAGLAAAEALVERSRDPVVVIEASGRPGGVIQSVRRPGWLVERAADCFLAVRPEAIDLVGRLGLADRLVPVEPAARRALILWEGRTVPVPRGFRLLAPGDLEAIRTTALLSAAGRERVLAEATVPPRDRAAGDESLESFAIRRLGREAFERLVQPLVAGIWTADPARLSMAAACPEFLQMEREHGSLTAGERARGAVGHQASGARYGQFVALADGMETLTSALWRRVSEAGVTWRHATAVAVTRDGPGYRVHTAAGPAAGEAAAAVVVACPAPAAARLLGGLSPPIADELAAIEYAGSAVVCLGFDRSAVGHPLDAAGVVVPRVAGRGCLAISFASEKFPGRAPAGGVLLRVFIGGALDPESAALPDGQLVERAVTEAREILSTTAPPRLVEIARWQGAMPQYHVGHVERVARIRGHLADHPGLALAGAAYEGVGIPQVIASGRAAGFSVAGAHG
jgi:oxygen-dependent protoporphyrinogen oxidase